jgi:hypothetical protein
MQWSCLQVDKTMLLADERLLLKASIYDDIRSSTTTGRSLSAPFAEIGAWWDVLFHPVLRMRDRRKMNGTGYLLHLPIHTAAMLVKVKITV